MKNHTHFILFLIIVFLTFSNSKAEELPLKKGSASIFWGLNGLSDLSVNNSYLGVQYLFKDGIGVWSELGLGVLSIKDYQDAESLFETNLEFGGGLIFYLYENEPVAFYITPCVWLTTYRLDDKDEPYQYYDTESEFWAGISFGGEWWFDDNISLSVETYLGYSKIKTTTKRGDLKTRETSYSFGILSEYGSNFSLSFYFR